MRLETRSKNVTTRNWSLTGEWRYINLVDRKRLIQWNPNKFKCNCEKLYKLLTVN